MAKRTLEPDEALGPSVDGLAEFPPPRAPEPEREEEEQETPFVPAEEEVTAIICGDDETARATARLALECGFLVKVALLDETTADWPEGVDFARLADYDDFVENCEVDRNSFVCVFLEDEDAEASILRQCLGSDAFYIGVAAGKDKRARLYDKMRADGAPDAELAAVNCPIGLNVGADTPARRAAAIVAEMLAARNGTLNRLLYAD